MSTIVYGCGCYGKFSYQHLHGLMLVKLNKIAFDLNLSHCEYRIIGILISLWNSKSCMASPTIEHLSEKACTSRLTVIRTLKKLVAKQLLIVQKQKGKTNKYFFTDKILKPNGVNHRKPLSSIPDKTLHEIKQIRKKQNISTKTNNESYRNTIPVVSRFVTNKKSQINLNRVTNCYRKSIKAGNAKKKLNYVSKRKNKLVATKNQLKLLHLKKSFRLNPTN